MPDSAFKEIRHLELFSQMADDTFSALMRGAYVQNFPAQIELITEGDPSDFLHVVLSGSVDLFSSWNGRETSLATVRPISTFILAATIKDAPYLMSARTLEKSRIALRRIRPTYCMRSLCPGAYPSWTSTRRGCAACERGIRSVSTPSFSVASMAAVSSSALRLNARR